MSRLHPRCAVLVAAAALAGCVSFPSSEVPVRECWSEPQQLAQRVREWPGVSQVQVLGAVETLMHQTWGDEAQVRRHDQGMTVKIRHEHTFYALLVARWSVLDEAWLVSTRPQAGATGVCVTVRGRYFTDTFVLGAEPVTHLVYPANESRRSHSPLVPGPRAAELDLETFWARLEYVLGLRREWAACPPTRHTGPQVSVNPLCHALVRDLPAPAMSRP